jgi:uncharacterized protein (DUF3820 family)
MKYTDETIMPSGKHIGEKLANIPASYLLYVYNNRLSSPALTEYITDNMEVLQFELKALGNTNLISKEDSE